MTYLWIKIVSVLTIIMIIGVMSYITIMIKRHKSENIYQVIACVLKGDLECFKRNINYVATHMIRLSLAGIVLLQISLLNTGLLKIKPDIQFIIAFFFYISFCVFVISNYKKEEKLRSIIKELQNKVK